MGRTSACSPRCYVNSTAEPEAINMREYTRVTWPGRNFPVSQPLYSTQSPDVNGVKWVFWLVWKGRKYANMKRREWLQQEKTCSNFSLWHSHEKVVKLSFRKSHAMLRKDSLLWLSGSQVLCRHGAAVLCRWVRLKVLQQYKVLACSLWTSQHSKFPNVSKPLQWSVCTRGEEQSLCRKQSHPCVQTELTHCEIYRCNISSSLPAQRTGWRSWFVMWKSERWNSNWKSKSQKSDRTAGKSFMSTCSNISFCPFAVRALVFYFYFFWFCFGVLDRSIGVTHSGASTTRSRCWKAFS